MAATALKGLGYFQEEKRINGVKARWWFKGMQAEVSHVTGKSGKNHKIPIAVKNNGMYIAVGFNKPNGHAVSKKDIKKFYEIVNDVKSGDHGTLLVDAVFGSSAGFKGEAIVELENLSKTVESDDENKLNFKTANFENRIYSVTKCQTNFFA